MMVSAAIAFLCLTGGALTSPSGKHEKRPILENLIDKKVPASPPITDNYVTVVTNKTNPLNTNVFLTTNNYFHFRLRACSDATVIWWEQPGYTAIDNYQILIGHDNNQKSTIRRTDRLYVTFDTPDILSCTEERGFFVKYDDKHVWFGKGLDVSVSPLDSLFDPEILTLHAISLASDHDQSALWKFQRREVTSMQLATEDKYSYYQYWLDTELEDQFLFGVKACAEAHIILSDQANTMDNVYEVALGILGNNKSAIRESKYGENVVVIETPGILSCDEDRFFWIQWKDNRLQVGSGSAVGSGVLMQHSRASHPVVQAAGLSTGWGSTGAWRIYNVEGSHPTVCDGDEEEGEQCKENSLEGRLVNMLEQLHEKLERLEEKVDQGLKNHGKQLHDKLERLEQKVDQGLRNNGKQLHDNLKRLEQKVDQGQRNIDQRLTKLQQNMDNGFVKTNENCGSFWG